LLELVRRQVELGPRCPGAAGHRAVREWIAGRLAAAADEWACQEFQVELPWGPAECANLAGVFRARTPAAKPLLLGTHFDTRWIGDREIPLLGVKFGDLGFLAEIAEENLFEAADRVLKGEFKISRRMRLDVQATRKGEALVRETVLNDIVINRGALARLANVITHINGHYLTTFRADGLIIATPTGSTAYSLAAGGPVIHPKVPGFIITPICPFTLTNRPLIVPDEVEITLRLDKGSSDIVLTLDGQTGLNLTDKDVITVRRSDHPLNLILLPDRHYFDVLKAKLRWSGGRV
jgi:NAD+ kinase